MAGREFNLESLLHLSVRHARAMLVAFAMAPMAAMVALRALPDSYEATARLLVQEQKSVNPFLEDISVEWTVKNRLPLIESIVESHSTLAKVLRQMGEIDKGATPEDVERRVREFERQVEVIGIGGGLVKIKVKGSQAAFVHRAAQALVAEFTAQMLEPQKQAVATSAKFLEGQIERLRGDIAKLEEELIKYKGNHATTLPELHQMNVETHFFMQKRLMESEARLAARERQKKLYEDKLRTLNPLARRLEAEIVEVETQLASLEVRYASEHPQVREARARLARLRADLKLETRRGSSLDIASLSRMAAEATVSASPDLNALAQPTDVFTSELLGYRGVLDDLEGTRSEVELLRARLSGSEEVLNAHASNQRALDTMQRDLDIKLGTYKSLLEKYESALVTEQLSAYEEASQVWTVEAPARPTSSLKPPWWLVLAGAVVGGVVLSVLSLAVFAALDDAVRGEIELAEATGAPALGRMPTRQAEP